MTAIPEVVARAGDVDDVHARTREVCGRLNRAHAELVDIMAELLETGLWGEGGIRTPEHWLIVRAGLAPGRARDIVTMARRKQELPHAAQALMAGRLSMDQAAVVARHVPATHSRAATHLAEKATVTQLRRVLNKYSYAADAPDADDPATDSEHDPTQPSGDQESDASRPGAAGSDTSKPNPIREEPQLQMHTRDGRFFLHYEGPESEGAIIERAIREAKDSLFQDGQSDATLADGLLEVANRSLSTITSTSRLANFRIYVHLDTEGGWLDRGHRLPKHMLDRLTCDGVIQPVWEREGHPVNVGRAQRIVPRRTRRLIEARDKGCRYPGCAVSGGHVEVHHIRHWRDGGETNTGELVCLCAYHHDAHHRGEFAISGNADDSDGLAFTGHGGWPLSPLTSSDADPKAQHRDTHGSGDCSRGEFDPEPAGPIARHLRLVDESSTGPEPPPPDFRGPTGERLHTKWVSFPPDADRCWSTWPRSFGGDAPDDDPSATAPEPTP